MPRLLDALAGDEAPRAAFAERWRGVSLSAFLPWVPSMLSLLGEQQGDALLPALQVDMPAWCNQSTAQSWVGGWLSTASTL